MQRFLEVETASGKDVELTRGNAGKDQQMAMHARAPVKERPE
jgi:hypothetical protein